MTSKQENRLSMFLAVIDYLTANARIVSKLPNFSGYFTALKESVLGIQTHAEQQMFNKTGITTSKKLSRSTLVMLGAETSRRLTAYAKFINNPVLFKEIKFTKSDLKGGADTALIEYAQGIYDRAQANLTDLATYGVTEETQTALQDAITAFTTSIPKPRLGITDKKQSTIQVVNYFDSADEALKNMDIIIEIVKDTETNFYVGYKGARKIVAKGSSSLSVKGIVTDAATGEPLKGVMISFCPECVEPTQKAAANGMQAAKEEVLLTKKTAKKGGYMVKWLPEGGYKVIVKKNGYQEQVVMMAVTNGETINLNIELSKN